MRGGMEWTPSSSLQPWLQYCRVCKSIGEQRQCQHGQGEKSLLWADFPGLSKGLWHLAEWSGCCAVPVLVSVWEWHPALPAASGKILAGRASSAPGWVQGNVPAASAVQHCHPTATSPRVPCARSVLLDGDCPHVWLLRNHQWAGQEVHQHCNECNYWKVWVWLRKDYTEK